MSQRGRAIIDLVSNSVHGAFSIFSVIACASFIVAWPLLTTDGRTDTLQRPANQLDRWRWRIRESVMDKPASCILSVRWSATVLQPSLVFMHQETTSDTRLSNKRALLQRSVNVENLSRVYTRYM